MVNINHINQELVSILNLMDFEHGIQTKRLEEKMFKQIKFNNDGASTSSEKLSLKEIIRNYSRNEKVTYYSYSTPFTQEPSYSKQQQKERSSFSVSSLSRSVQVLEMTIRKVSYLGKPSYMMIIQDISNIIESQTTKLQQHY
mmetsp:Transcript_14632/g.22682  ORF Transcript_14632/g.22682 Transcript_14632/m.22682 type:complete len:142 (+) Transcript_14632:1515-1940(+)